MAFSDHRVYNPESLSYNPSCTISFDRVSDLFPGDYAEAVFPRPARLYIAYKAVCHYGFALFEQIAEIAVAFDYDVPFFKFGHLNQ